MKRQYSIILVIDTENEIGKVNSNIVVCIHFVQMPQLLYIDLRPGQTCHSKDDRSCIFRWPVMGRDCVGKLG